MILFGGRLSTRGDGAKKWAMLHNSEFVAVSEHLSFFHFIYFFLFFLFFEAENEIF
jgi:hypothetical protein